MTSQNSYHSEEHRKGLEKKLKNRYTGNRLNFSIFLSFSVKLVIFLVIMWKKNQDSTLVWKNMSKFTNVPVGSCSIVYLYIIYLICLCVMLFLSSFLQFRSLNSSHEDGQCFKHCPVLYIKIPEYLKLTVFMFTD